MLYVASNLVSLFHSGLILLSQMRCLLMSDALMLTFEVYTDKTLGGQYPVLFVLSYDICYVIFSVAATNCIFSL